MKFFLSFKILSSVTILDSMAVSHWMVNQPHKPHRAIQLHICIAPDLDNSAEKQNKIIHSKPTQESSQVILSLFFPAAEFVTATRHPFCN